MVMGMLDVDKPEKGKRGRPNLRWKDACNRDMTKDNITTQSFLEEETKLSYRRTQTSCQAREKEVRSVGYLKMISHDDHQILQNDRSNFKYHQTVNA